MAQYGKNFYGSAYYGITNLFTGWYETTIMDAEEPLNGVVNAEIKVQLPKTNMLFNKTYYNQLTGWSFDEEGKKATSLSSEAKMVFEVTTDTLIIPYMSGLNYGKILVNVETQNMKTSENTTESFEIDCNENAIDKEVLFKKILSSFNMHKVTLTVITTENQKVVLGAIKASTTRLRIEGHKKNNDTEFDLYKEFDLVLSKELEDDYVLLKGSTLSYEGFNLTQFRVYLETSDNDTSPVIDYIKFSSGDSSLRDSNGVWYVDINMSKVAEKTKGNENLFEKVTGVDWTEVVPDNTTITIRSASTSGGATSHGQLPNFSKAKQSVPYKKNTNRIKLKDNVTTGYIITPKIAPQNTMPYSSNKGWLNYEHQLFLPPNNSSTFIGYTFLNTLDNEKESNGFYRIDYDNESEDKSLFNSDMNIGDLNSEFNRSGKDFYLKIKLERDINNETPVVDWINFYSQMDYQQDVQKENDNYSAVDFSGTGKGVIFKTSEFKEEFVYPNEVKEPIYSLIDITERPNDVMLYFDSQKGEAIRDGRVISIEDNDIWIEAKLSEKNDGINNLMRHFQYGGGEVKFPDVQDVELAPIFTPALKSNLQYKFYSIPYWETQYHTTRDGDTLDSIALNYVISKEKLLELNKYATFNSDGTLMKGQNLELPNNSKNEKIELYWKSNEGSTLKEEHQQYNTTKKFSQNAILKNELDVSSDTLIVKLRDSSIYGWVDWVSEEKIYNGFVNLNDIRSEYKRNHGSVEAGTSEKTIHVVEKDETLISIIKKYGLEEDDIIFYNENINSITDEILTGDKITIPNKIVLPKIEAGVITEENPYEISIVYKSAKKKDGSLVDEKEMLIKPLEITYKEKMMIDVPMIRGDVKNGNDLLPHKNITRIISIESKDKLITYNPYSSSLKTGDYKLEQDRIYWSPVESSSIEPKKGEVYYVSYYVNIPEQVTLTIDTSHQEKQGIDRIWRSPEVKEFTGICDVNNDFLMEMPNFEEWEGLPNNRVEDIQYVIEDNDIWVKTWVEERNGKDYLIGSLEGKDPEKNWYPTINTGFYYLGKEEFYMYSEPIYIKPGKTEIPIAANVEYKDGIKGKGVSLRKGTTNYMNKNTSEKNKLDIISKF